MKTEPEQPATPELPIDNAEVIWDAILRNIAPIHGNLITCVAQQLIETHAILFPHRKIGIPSQQRE